MLTRVRVLGVSVLLSLAGMAGAQVEPPPAVPVRGTLPPAAGPSDAAARPNQPLTINAMMTLKGEPIFLTDIFRPIDANLRDLAANAASTKAFEDAARPLIRKSLSDLATDILVVSVAESKLTAQDKERIDIFMNLEKSRLLASYGGVESAAERALQASGSSIAREMRARRRAVIKRLYVEKYLWSQVVVTRQMVVDAYEKDPARWKQTAAVELFAITLPVSNWLRSTLPNGEKGPILANPTEQQIKDAQAQAMATGREIIAKLKAGADFARLVEDYNSADEFRSKGGSRGLITRGSMVDSKLEDYIFSLPANTIGEQPYLDAQPNFRNSTVRVVKVGAKRDARTIPFEEAEATLLAELRAQQQKELERQELSKLSEGAGRELEALDRNLPWAVDAAVARYFTR